MYERQVHPDERPELRLRDERVKAAEAPNGIALPSLMRRTRAFTRPENGSILPLQSRYRLRHLRDARVVRIDDK